MVRRFERSYAVGTKVQRRNGYIFVKTDDGLIAESRRNWELQKGELKPGDKVFHIDGDRTNNRIGNLAKIHYNQTKFVFLKESKVLWRPKLDKKAFTREMVALAHARLGRRNDG